ncbi:MAG: PAS domain S-box protein [candidate division NC10 bacterium]|nr:PAS domain S-box protein [candidate division NC10 bacterium]
MPGEKAPRRPAGATPGMLQKLKWLTGIRLLLASALLGSAFALDLHERLPFPTPPLYGLLGLTFGLSLVYALALRSQRHLLFQGLVQLGLDLGLVSLLVHFTGGLDSAFPFMYIFVIFGAANVLERRGSLLVAILSGGLYGILVAAEWTRLLPPAEFAGGLAPLRPAGYAVYQVLIHAVAFLAVAILSSHLVERLRQAGQELERRGLDLRNLQTLHWAIVANIPSGIMTLDLAGRVISFNAAAEQITGYDFKALRDRPWQETPFAACLALAEFFAQPEAPLATPATELYLQRRDGRPIPLGIACSPLRAAEGEPVGLVAIFQDLTERKRVEEHLRRADRLAALGQLAANIAHEVRNPLAAISGSVEVLREDLAPAGPQRQLLDIILREASRLKLITGQFLDFAKPQPLLFRPCPLRPLLDETLHLLAKSSERHPEMTWVLTEEEPDLHVLADLDQLRQVVWNLCLNAMQAMSEGGTLTIALRPAPHGSQSVSSSIGQFGKGEAPKQSDQLTTRPMDQLTSPSEGDGQLVNSSIGQFGRAGDSSREDHLTTRPLDYSTPPTGGEWVEIVFHDTGRGIPPQELERIFDPFYTTRPSGTGLGLSIARKLLESMDGRIGVESRPGTGTTFRIWLHRAPVTVGAESRK